MSTRSFVEERDFIRDGRAPIPEKLATSRVMRANKAKNTTPEILFRKALWAYGIRGYRIHWKKAPGRPDIAFPGKRLAVFINGCFWHMCPNCKPPVPRTNSKFWKEKFIKNKERDKKKIELLETAGWRVLVVWECETKNDLDRHIKTVHNLINSN